MKYTSKIININNKIIKIYIPINMNNIRLIILNSYESSSDNIINKCIKNSIKPFILVEITNINWNNELSPWYYKDNNTIYDGNANIYLNELINIIIPKINNYINSLNINITYYSLIGYSLAGLFALYASYNTNIFTSIASISGSLWYPNIINYIKNNNISTNINKIYFSLGNKENKIKNSIMSKVRDNTIIIEQYINNLHINTIYEENEGNHFNNIDTRIYKAIKWLL